MRLTAESEVAGMTEGAKAERGCGLFCATLGVAQRQLQAKAKVRRVYLALGFPEGPSAHLLSVSGTLHTPPRG